MYIKRVYKALIDKYFPYASFYKSTGDGLLLTIQYNDSNLKETAQKVIADCMRCHSEFAHICDGDPMINYTTPDKIGIGIARGTACCLVSEAITIDYSGRLLNLTSRLNDLARPSGIVIDGAFDISLLSDEQQKLFSQEKVYIKGIYEDAPIKIRFTPQFTKISLYNKQPIAAEKWDSVSFSDKFGEFVKISTSGLRMELNHKPLSKDNISVEVTFPSVVDKKIMTGVVGSYTISDFKYENIGGKHSVVIPLSKLCAYLKKEEGVTDEMLIEIEASYMIK
jgi:hypothetical protein